MHDGAVRVVGDKRRRELSAVPEPAREVVLDDEGSCGVCDLDDSATPVGGEDRAGGVVEERLAVEDAGSRGGEGVIQEVGAYAMELVELEARRVTRERGAFRSDQFENQSNVAAHHTGTGQEIWEQTGGRIDAFADFVGTGGCLAGVTCALKEHKPSVRCFAVEPAGAAVLAGEAVPQPNHPIQGGGFSRADLTHLRDVPIDGYVQVTGEEARSTARLLATREGIFGGFSAGANVSAALHLLRNEMAGATIAVLIPDSGLKYLSTDLWE
ncbi:pyridoxal-phosphate dependent enzyme [Streptosporangium subroseum]|uniref:PLP-dependent cysteine synthase family protein n=1 Tax=Streptosporangium subroseum TaxID=106412 RepID=UPI00342D38AA